MTLHRFLVALPLCAGGLAAYVGTPQPPLAPDEVSADQLAGWIRERRSGLHVLDTRSDEAMDRDRLPGARPATEIGAGEFGVGDTVVVYADRTPDEQTVATLRQRLPSQGVLRLHGGIEAWNADVLFPTLRSNASERQKQEFVTRAQLSRYFGGAPRVLDPAATRPRFQGRRGC